MAKIINATIKDGKIRQCNILLTPEEIAENPFASKDGRAMFYHFIEKTLKNVNKTVAEDETPIENMDCKYINVAKNIQAAWYDYAKEHNIDQTALSMQICFCGPKALDEIPDNQIQILENYITYESES